jgi:hypothetical protein
LNLSRFLWIIVCCELKFLEIPNFRSWAIVLFQLRKITICSSTRELARRHLSAG